MKIMLIDDDEFALETLARVLETAGFEVFSYAQPEQAVTAFDQSFSVVLSDLKMPAIDGYEVLKRVKAVHAGVRFILTTGFADPAHIALAVESGADSVISKPLNIFELIKHLKVFAESTAPAR